ncbi:MAG: hypothetical protein DME11_08985 [Candidatus Rokuibacteriota bacterium]|nr:MAG: hypothetical protein DMD80_16015 [Candidatus Rokubacteria bacterium]PYM65872.1 MAG: hypothetical protein DME11_08985 [Candidatus Rokubacteria bacterium]
MRAPRSGDPPARDPDDFSVVLGGPLYQLIRRAHLAGDALQLWRRRIVVIALVAWLPLLILSMLEKRAWGDAVAVPFLLDIEVHVRFLLTLPLLIVAELVVHQRMRPLVREFLERGLLPDASRARFDAAVAAAQRLRNSAVAEGLLIALVYVVGLLVWPHYGELNVATWYAVPARGGRELSPAGWWFVYVSLPLFQFILLRWYFRLFVWIRFLAQVARCTLSLVPTHPDRVAGLGFLSGSVVAFAPLLAAHGTLLTGVIANRIFFQGAALLEFKVELVVVVAFLLLVVLGPLLLFTPHLATARRVGLREYGTLAQRYVRAFDDKWLRGGASAGEPLVGSADIQSLADLGNSFELVRSMRVVPITRDALLQLAVITLLPVAPLLLTMISLEELLKRLLQVVF